MPDLINLTLVSPSKVGIYASCPIRLVWDSAAPRSFTGSKWADFGTVCHWITMDKLGCAPHDVPTEKQLASARELEPSKNDEIYNARLERCTDLAVKALKTEYEKLFGPMPDNVCWVSEIPVHDPTLLPTRTSRPKENNDGTITPGKVVGFGGSMDLMSSNRLIVVDLKFVSKPVTKLKIEYLWQLGSYAMLSGIMKTMILWLSTDGKNYYYLVIDWSLPHFRMLLDKIRKFVERTGHANFAAHAIPNEGEHCEYCESNPGSRNYSTSAPVCPLKHVPMPQQGNDAASQQGDLSWFDEAIAQNASVKTGEKLF